MTLLASVSDLVGSPEDRFSNVRGSNSEVHIMNEVSYINYTCTQCSKFKYKLKFSLLFLFFVNIHVKLHVRGLKLVVFFSRKCMKGFNNIGIKHDFPFINIR